MNLKENVILSFGVVRKYKGLIYLIKALPEVVKEIDIDLLIVGEFWDNKQKYIDLINILGIENNVKIIDRYIPNEEVGKYFEIADVIVLPYISGSQSGIIQIAYAFNKPVITTNSGGYSEVVIEGKTGFVVQSKNYEELAKKIIKFFKLKNRNNFVRYIKKVKEKYSWENYIKLLLI
ncbi:Spore coat protein SA [subsurface metagenome]